MGLPGRLPSTLLPGVPGGPEEPLLGEPGALPGGPSLSMGDPGALPALDPLPTRLSPSEPDLESAMQNNYI